MGWEEVSLLPGRLGPQQGTPLGDQFPLSSPAGPFCRAHNLHSRYMQKLWQEDETSAS